MFFNYKNHNYYFTKSPSFTQKRLQKKMHFLWTIPLFNTLSWSWSRKLSAGSHEIIIFNN